MLKCLRIKNFILIDNLEIDFEKGFNVITGETGAGKSIIINAIDVVLGGKHNPNSIGAFAEKAYLELTLDIKKENVEDLFASYDLELDTEIIISKEISKSSSRFRLNGNLISLDFIKELRDKVIDINSQHQSYSSLQTKNHLNLLDLFSDDDHKQALLSYRETYMSWQETKKRFEYVKEALEKNAQELDFLKFQKQELENAAISDLDEDSNLKKQIEIISNTQELKDLSYKAFQVLSADDFNITDALYMVKKNISQIVKYDENMEKSESDIIDAIEIVKDLSRTLSSYSDNISFSEEEIDELQTRLDILEKIKRKYGGSLQAAQEFYDSVSQKIQEIDISEEEINDLEQKTNSLYNLLMEKASVLTEKRMQSADILSQKITKELQDLDLAKALFKIDIKNVEPNQNGCDDVEFLITTNVSQPPASIAKVASGGELSRIMLALKTVFAKQDKITSIIFDEIDTGISGKTSQAVADKISELSKYHQIISITHQPIIAAKADYHIFVKKEQNENTQINVKILNREERISAIAELASGQENEQSKKFAELLLKE